MLREQRLVFVLVGIAIATSVFTLLPSSTTTTGAITDAYSISEPVQLMSTRRSVYPTGFDSFNLGGKIPLGLKRKGLRIAVTGGADECSGDIEHARVGKEDWCALLANKHQRDLWGTIGRNIKADKELVLLLTGVRSCYDEGKRTAETLTMDYHRGASVEVRIARIFNTYGPRMCIDDGRVVSNFVAQALRKEPLTVYGDGKQTRSFQYVSDVVEGLMRLMVGEHVGPFNLGNPGEFTMLELAQVVQETIDPNAKTEFKPNTEDDPHKRKPDITKAKELLGWQPKVPLRKGLPMMVSDFRQRIFGDQNTPATATTTSSSAMP
ncbi:hypothetical protein L1987_59474 [Smallanthus sonchifolius]|uniref:Uncharacterized protein n=1 Tax=Smallanthus sonchifolius TaxID=185202 RepID=A0ACB9D5F5_9ASTR|nr:hypothetical protein L1987_59474 [Smallanthus sonchifolius]